MNIKSLLLGSAAALVAVSGARAADAVMAPEPEPVEYVRVCDAYGAGFFYIPGTETCLQISGYVWFQVSTNGYNGGFDTLPAFTGTNGWSTWTRARLNVDARSETELGTLRSYIRLQADYFGAASADATVGLDQAFIELGGFKMGYSESFWVDSGNGPGSNYGSLNSWTGMYYGYQQRALIGYRFESNGFFGAISLEDDAMAGRGYMPDVVAKVGYSGGWGSVWAKVAYDESFDGSPWVNANLGIVGVNNGGWAAQVGALINIPNMPGSALKIVGNWADGANAFNIGGPSVNGIAGTSLYGGSEWSVLVSYNQQFSETLGASVGFQWFNNLYYAGTDLSRGNDAWAAELSVVWFPVRQFEVRSEIRYQDVQANALYAHPNPAGSLSGYLRFTRYF